MGGLALKEFGVIRLAREQFDEVRTSLLAWFSSNMPKVRTLPVVSYRDKKTFGDIDIVYSTEDPDFISTFISLFGVQHYKHNGDCFSFVYDTKYGPFQVDLIWSAADCINFAYHYFNFNDLGNFLGRVYHKAGFKLGHAGLLYVVRSASNPAIVLKEITVTKYWLDAMQFMGYGDYFKQSFNTVEDLFSFALSSPYSNKHIYYLENRNHKARVRDRKRANYSLLLEWVKNPETPCEDYDWSDKEWNRSLFLEKAFKRWPQFKHEYEKTLELEKIGNNRKEKFNGDLVRAVTGLEGKQLGVLINKIHVFFGDRFNEWVDSASDSDIEKAIECFGIIFSGNYKPG